ncbi:hypothetical protein GCM10027570_20250 [Streptomonospora sediminis]
MSRRDPLAGGETAALDGLDEIEAAQVRRCARVLLRHPLLRAQGADGETLSAVRRYAERLQTLFAGYLGYRLVVEPAFARLYKTGRSPDGVRGAHKANGAPFTPRAYTYLALVLAALTGGGGQLLLSSLVSEVRAMGAEAGVELGSGIVDRRALAAALRHLIDLGVLTETDGSVSPWAEDAEREALLTVDAELLGHLVAAPLARVGAPEELAAPAGAEGRHRVRRRIVEDPVVPHSSLDPADRDWLRANLGGEAHLLEELTGLQLQVRAEGVLAVDPEGYLTDRNFPGTGTVARIALLAAAELLAEAAPEAESGNGRGGRSGSGRSGTGSGGSGAGGGPSGADGAEGWVRVGTDRLAETVAALAERYPRAWSREAVRDTARLAGSVTRTLAQVGLARTAAGTAAGTAVEISTAAARYRPVPDGPEAGEGTAEGTADAEGFEAGDSAVSAAGQEPLFSGSGGNGTGQEPLFGI